MIAGLLARAASEPLHLTFNARRHSIVAGRNREEIAAALRGWTCHVCGVCLPRLMEFDGGHGNREFRPICQLCHNIDHAVWSAAVGRLELVWAPDIAQEDLTRLCWTLLGLGQLFPDLFDGELAPGDGTAAVGWGLAENKVARLQRAARVALGVREFIESRREAFSTRFRATTAEAFLETLIVQREKVKGAAAGAASGALAGIRAVPAVVLAGFGETDVQARISVWSGSGFEDVSGRVAEAFLAGLEEAERVEGGQ